ncbi:MAG TPA: hypothetical protein VMT32_17965 [Bryobacteraceae bacterium]|nr:hypothetical protein [Bryobacteraceae bacterium]
MTTKAYLCLTQTLFVLACATIPALAGDKQGAAPADSASQEVSQLKVQLADQQRQIEELRTALQKLLASKPTSSGEDVTPPANTAPSAPGVPQLGQVASTTPIVPAAPAVKAPLVFPMPAAAAQQQNVVPESPLQIHIGSATITPVGFMDFTGVFRTTNPGSGIGTNFGSVPYNTGTTGNISEFRLSAQNSRLGIRVDANVKGASVLGYMESDFLGFNPGNVAVTSNSNSMRLRLYWVDVRKDKVEVFGGQSWSMLTPNRKGLSALPGDLFYSQNIDVNYQNGLVWSRNPQFRFIVHPNDKVAMGVSLENPEQYIGGSGGGGLITLPAAYATPYGNQLNNGNTTLSVPDTHPDIIAKIATDPSSRAHFEIAGLFRTFRVFDPLEHTHHTAHGYGGSANVNLEIAKGLRLLSNNYWSDGGGRWIFGLAPDLIVRPDGTLSPLHAGSTVDGLELAVKHTLLYAYYGGTFIRRDFVVDTSGAKPVLVGYGYPGSSNSQNRAIHEPTVGFTQTFWRDPKYGALQLMMQYSYVLRYPWADSAPRNAHTSMVFLNLRYSLPGSAPTALPALPLKTQ